MEKTIVVLTAFVGTIAGRAILDLTHVLDENAPAWPLEGYGIRNVTYFESETLYAGDDFGVWISMKKVEYFEHIGTHIDAPSHFGVGLQAIHEIPPEKLIGPGIMIDVKNKVTEDQHYAVTVDDIKEFEEKNGRIPPHSIVLLNTGWAANYHDPKLNFGTEDPTNPATFKFPGFSIEACTMLHAERQVSVVGGDTPSIEPAQYFACHQYLQTKNVPLLEYVANLDTMPATGTTVFVGSPKHRGGSGGPTRVMAVIDNDDGTSAAGRSLALSYGVICLTVITAFFNS